MIVHVAPFPPTDVETRDGVPITSTVRTIRDIAAHATVDEVASILREGEERGFLRRRKAQELANELLAST